MAKDDALNDYQEKRDFKRTSEPSDGAVADLTRPIYVIQKHDASNLHYDFRLEIDGVLKSWAVPKGPSTDPSEKRLAVLTEDHPLAYSEFEGVIPEDEYGAGTVLVWDIGSYENTKDKSLRTQFENGRIEVFLKGTKLQGGYAVIRAKVGNSDDNWLLIKMDDEYADARRNPVSTEPDSALSGRSLKEIEQAATS